VLRYGRPRGAVPCWIAARRGGPCSFQLILSVLPPASQPCPLHFLRMVSGLGGLAVDIKVRSAGRFRPDRVRDTLGMPLCLRRAADVSRTAGGSRAALGPG
jgi:hypothetical protein